MVQGTSKASGATAVDMTANGCLVKLGNVVLLLFYFGVQPFGRVRVW